ncbi:MAG TPA: PIN domain-containing protein [Tepidisphaeraceae bacterium]|nr:PIN domain-containing protein [Tepidisphaeraceae bacterium]
MPDEIIIVDTGPLIAFLVEQDQHHDWAVEQFKSLPAPFFTCEAVLAETFHIVQRWTNGSRRALDLLDSDALLVGIDIMEQRKPIRQLMLKYRNVPMSLADACLVRLSEIHRGSSVFTLDSDFAIYRRNGREQINVISPR